VQKIPSTDREDKFIITEYPEIDEKAGPGFPLLLKPVASSRNLAPGAGARTANAPDGFRLASAKALGLAPTVAPPWRAFTAAVRDAVAQVAGITIR